MDWWIDNGGASVKGKVRVPADKSVSHRAAMFAAISDGKCRISNFLFADDCLRTVEALKSLGTVFDRESDGFLVQGVGLRGFAQPAAKEIYLGNSGTSMRILPGILCGQDLELTLRGDESLSGRPMERIIEPLSRMGARVEAAGRDGRPPIRIRPAGTHLRSLEYDTPVASAQVKSCLLAAGLYADGPSRITEPFPSRDHTERMLSFMGVELIRDGRSTVIRPGVVKAADLHVPGDISSAAFFIVAGLVLENSQVHIDNVGINPTRSGILNVLQRMGGRIVLSDIKEGMEPVADVHVVASRLKGTVVRPEEVPGLIDEIPVLAVAAAFAEGETVIEGVAELKVKESDRLRSICENFRRLGIPASEEGDNLLIKGSPGREIRGAEVLSYNDHRMAMSMAVCAMASRDGCNIRDVDCVGTSYPDFYRHLQEIRVKKGPDT